MEYLDLSYTFLQGPADGRVPEFLGSLNTLRHLDLTGMPFSGPYLLSSETSPSWNTSPSPLLRILLTPPPWLAFTPQTSRG
jgi:hypothetical protein